MQRRRRALASAHRSECRGRLRRALDRGARASPQRRRGRRLPYADGYVPALAPGDSARGTGGARATPLDRSTPSPARRRRRRRCRALRATRGALRGSSSSARARWSRAATDRGPPRGRAAPARRSTDSDRRAASARGSPRAPTQRAANAPRQGPRGRRTRPRTNGRTPRGSARAATGSPVTSAPDAQRDSADARSPARARWLCPARSTASRPAQGRAPRIARDRARGEPSWSSESEVEEGCMRCRREGGQ